MREIDLLLELENWLMLLFLPVAVWVGFYAVGRALPVRLGLAIFAAGTGTLAFLTYRLYRSQVDYCADSPEVAEGGDKLSCLEPGNWFAFNLALLTFLIAELGLAILVVGGLVRWQKKRRFLATLPLPSKPPST